MRAAAALVALASLASAIPGTDRPAIKPSHEAAKKNAHHIFNEIHSAARQWGSSLNHNGMGFIPATVLKGSLFYHGTLQKDTPTVPEWLAFEVEHAENFAPSRRWRNPDDHDGNRRLAAGEQQPIGSAADGSFNYRGYLHTYQTRRDLNLLYLDGLAAAKAKLGTLDSQDYVLRRNESIDDFWDERPRAKDLCNIVTPWGYDGVIRTEIGFEIIHCNFTDSLDLVSRTRTEIGENKMTWHDTWNFDWARAAGHRYDGIGADRIKLDYSSMVSGYFFPMNISSQVPDRPDLMRLASAEPEELHAIRDVVEEIARQERRHTVNWQGIVDQVITRFADRFVVLTAEEGVSDTAFKSELEGMTLTYYDAPPHPLDENSVSMAAYYDKREEEAVERCSKQFLLPATIFKDQFSPQDDLIHSAVAEVTHTICSKTQRIWVQLNRTITEDSPSWADEDEASLGSSLELRRRADDLALASAVSQARSAIRDLMDELAWTDWKKPRPCAADAIPYVAMWPFGVARDHWNPGCRSLEELEKGKREKSYWDDRYAPWSEE